MPDIYFVLIFVFYFFCFLHAFENSHKSDAFHDISRSKRQINELNEFGNQTQRQCFYKNVKKCFDGAFTDNIWCLESTISSKLAQYYWDQAIYNSYTPNFKEHFINCTTSKIIAIIEPDTPGIFKELNKLKDKPSPRLGSKMKIEHQECIEKYTWKCIINKYTLNCYMNMRFNEIAEIINFCSNFVYKKLRISLDTFEDVLVS